MDSSTKYDNPNPRLTTNPFSKLIFWWLKPLLQYGRNHDLDVKNLYNTLPDDLSEPLGDALEKNWKKEVDAAKDEKRAPRLRTALQNTYMWPYCYYGFWVFLCIFFRVLQPYILGLLIWHFDPRSESTTTDAYIYATGVVLILFINGLLEHHTNSKQMEFGMRIRVACSSLVYRKILKLSISAANKTACGQVLNLLSNDVTRFDYIFIFLHYLWIMPIQVFATGYLIWRSVGPAAAAGILLMIVQTLPLQAYLSKLNYKYRGKVAVRTDERVRMMSEIISGIQVIKMYTWEKPFQHLVALARKYEVDILTVVSYLRGFNYATYVFTERIALYFTVMAYVLAGNNISADIVFSIAQHMNKLQLTIAIFCPQAVAYSAEALVSIKRLEDFLVLEEHHHHRQPLITENKSEMIKLKQVTASWCENVIANTLHDINITVNTGQLCTIIGPVGAGKTSLLLLILGELGANHGHVTIGGRISYASQEPWLFAGSVKNNILFGQPYDDKKYRKVIKACSLAKDFIQLPYGDKTLIGEKGAGLSGGQKARINLARACYKDADIYLLDDPLSAVDVHVGKSLFRDCIRGLLANKTIILITHQVQHLKDVDTIVMLNNGVIQKQGNYQSFHNDDFKLLAHEDPDSLTEEINDGRIELRRLSLRRSSIQSRKESVVSSIDVQTDFHKDDDDNDSEPAETKELMSTGSIEKALYWKYFRAGGSICMIIVFFITMILGQIGSSGSDYFVAYWTMREEDKFKNYSSNNNNNDTKDNNTNEDKTNQTNFETFSRNLSSIMNDYNNTLIPNTLILDQNTTNNKTDNNEINTNTALWIYGALIILCVVMTIARNMTFLKICMNASKNLHNIMFECLLKAPMRFFNTNSSGRILNRFTKDIGCADELLPRSMMEAIQIYAVMIGIFIQIIIVNWWTIFMLILMGCLYWVIKNVYIATAQDVKRLEGITKSPVFSHVNSSLAGLTTIRSSNSQELVRKEFDAYQDVHTSAWSLIIFTSGWFGLWLDIVTISFVTLFTYSLIFLNDNNTYPAGAVGLALSQVLILCGMLQYGIRTTAESMTQMTSVERIMQFTKLDEEGPFVSEPNRKPPAVWPDKGKIEFQHMFLSYDSSEDKDVPQVLKDLNFTVDAGMKVGIVGRTGAGKSSLISALFHLAKIDGDIIIDHISTKIIGLTDLRCKLSIIPQDPVLFSASIRDNLDPFHEREDNVLWSALEEVELKSSVITSLNHIVTQGGSNFSVGQRQLICLARAIVRSNKILILDEATANVDPATDALIQKTIRLKFKDCTVLTIAHRLNTVMDSDKILVMDSGRVVEYNHPHILLQNPQGIFTKMLDETEKSMISNLKKVSEDSYNRLHDKH